jgi:hypothetical protein
VLASEPLPPFIAVNLPDLCGQAAPLRIVGDALSKAGVPTLVVSADDAGKKPKVAVVAFLPKGSTLNVTPR